MHAAFYLWYGNPATDGRWLHWDHPTLPHWTAEVNARHPPHAPHTPPDKPHSTFYPQRGLYSSRDRVILLEQMRELKAAGVSSVMLSWWGQAAARVRRDSQGVSTDEAIPLALEAAAAANLTVSWHLEPYGGRNASSVRADVEYLHERYGAHPAVYRSSAPCSRFFGRLVCRSPRPLVFLYDVSAEHAGASSAEREQSVVEWRGATDALRGAAHEPILLSLYHDRRDADFVERCGFDGAYTYFAAAGFTEGSTPAYWAEAQRQLTARQKLFIPSIGARLRTYAPSDAHRGPRAHPRWPFFFQAPGTTTRASARGTARTRTHETAARTTRRCGVRRSRSARTLSRSPRTMSGERGRRSSPRGRTPPPTAPRTSTTAPSTACTCG